MIFPRFKRFLATALLMGGTLQGIAQEADSAGSNADNLYYDAVKARMLGDHKQSEQLLQQVIREKPEEAAPYYDLARISILNNKPDQAETWIKKALALDGKNKWYREQYANILALRNNYEEAGREFGKLAKDERFNEEYLLKSALLYQRAGKYKEALHALDELQQKNGDAEEILLQKQQIYLKMNDLESAVGVIREIIKRNPREPRYYILLAELYNNNKQAAKAKEVYAEMQERFPNDPALQLSLATEAMKKGDTAGYRSYVRKAITNRELDAETQLALLRPYLQEIEADSFKRQEALLLIEQVVAQHPEDAMVLTTYGDVLLFNSLVDQSTEQYKKAIAKDPSKFYPWERLLYGYTEPRHADSLIRYSEKAARLFPTQAIVHYLNGIGHYNRKSYIDAIRSINRAVDLESEDNAPSLSQMYSTLGDIYHATKEYRLSDSSYDHALRLDPDNASVLNNYAYYLSLRKERLTEAERMSKKSLELRPGEGTFLDTYGWILYQQGKYEEARKYIQQAIDKSPDATDATLWEHLAAAQYKLGNVEQAVAAWKKAKAAGTDNKQIDKMIADRKLYE